MNRKQAVESARAFLKDPILSSIFYYCKLQLLQDDWKYWIDHLGYKLTITENRSIRINRYLTEFVDDLYLKAHPKILLKKAKEAAIIFDESGINLWTVDNNNRLRGANFQKDWITQPPLAFGLKPVLEAIGLFKNKLSGPNIWKVTHPIAESFLEEMFKVSPELTDHIIELEDV